ncbi:unnamed protein product [Phytophthora fragariaefolia]|uniref:Unnamed protein product n=1 Tax=Phytophthora fragariaefolia TaxID=1490495 RepID=A0A9W6U978_9STRA|nr:unnamed protein product [Phytophthora fragariaefolia]
MNEASPGQTEARTHQTTGLRINSRQTIIPLMESMDASKDRFGTRLLVKEASSAGGDTNFKLISKSDSKASDDSEYDGEDDVDLPYQPVKLNSTFSTPLQHTTPPQIKHFQFFHEPEPTAGNQLQARYQQPSQRPRSTMTKLTTILSFTAACVLALATLDGVNGASLRALDADDSFPGSFDASTDASDSGAGERLLLEMEGSDDSTDADVEGSESLDGERFLGEVEGSDSAETDDGSDSFAGERFLQEVGGSDESGETDDGSESTDGGRFLLEVEGSDDSAATDDGSTSVGGERFLAEVDVEGSDSAESSDSSDGERFLVEMEGSESGEDEGSASAGEERFLEEVAGSESDEGSESGSA